MTSNIQQRQNSLNRSLQFEHSINQENQFMENDTNQNNGHHNRFSRIIHSNHHSNIHKNSMSYDNHYSTFDEQMLNYSKNNYQKVNSGNSQSCLNSMNRNIIQKVNNNNTNSNLISSSNNNNIINNNFVYNNNIVSLSLEQPKRYKPKKNNLKNSLNQAEKVYSQGLNNSNVSRNTQIQVSSISKEKRTKIDIESLQNKILNEGVRGYEAKDCLNDIIVNYAPNLNQMNQVSTSSAKISQNNMRNINLSNNMSSNTPQQIQVNQNQQINLKDSKSGFNRLQQKIEADRQSNITAGSCSKNNDNLNTTISNNRCSSMMSFNDEHNNSCQSNGFSYSGQQQNELNQNILDSLIGSDINISGIKEKLNLNNSQQNKSFKKSQGDNINQILKPNEIKYINAIKQKMSQGENNMQSVSARYQIQSQQSTVSNQQQMQNEQKSLQNVFKCNRYGDIVDYTGEQSSKSNNSFKSILTEKRKYKIDENSQTQINNQQQNQLNKFNPSALNNSNYLKCTQKENNPNISLDSTIAAENHINNFESYNCNQNNSGGQIQSLNQQKGNSNNQYQQQIYSTNRSNKHQQLSIGNSVVAPSTNNHTSKSINIVNRQNNFAISNNINNQRHKDYSYDSIQHDQLPSQQLYSFILNPRSNSNTQYNTISHSSNSGFISSKGSIVIPKRKKIQINTKLLNSNQSKTESQLQNSQTFIGEDKQLHMVKQKTTDIIEQSANLSLTKYNTKNGQQINMQNQHLLTLFQNLKDCFNKFKSRQEDINECKYSKKYIQESTDKNIQSQVQQNNQKIIIQRTGECNSSSSKNNVNSKTENIKNMNQYKYHKIGLNILSRLFKKKYSYKFFISLIKENQNDNNIHC